MSNQVVLSLDGKLRDVVTRGLKWYKQGLEAMVKVISNFTDSRLISDEIESTKNVINQLNKQSPRFVPKKTVLNQCNEESLIKEILSNLQNDSESVVVAGLANDEHWIKAKYVWDKGYELRVDEEIVLETTDLEVITEAFVSWGNRKKIDGKQKTY